jgi:hypothetical protein
MLGGDAGSPAAFQNGMDSDDLALIENADYIGQLLHLDNAASTVRDAVIVAADRQQPVVADTPLELEQRVERPCRQRLQLGPLGGKCLSDDFLGGAVHAPL